MNAAPLVLGAVIVVLALSSCAEREQTAQAQPRRPDTVAWQGAENPYSAPGWKAGDRTSWEEQMRNRAQAQNEYRRVL